MSKKAELTEYMSYKQVLNQDAPDTYRVLKDLEAQEDPLGEEGYGNGDYSLSRLMLLRTARRKNQEEMRWDESDPCSKGLFQGEPKYR